SLFSLRFESQYHHSFSTSSQFSITCQKKSIWDWEIRQSFQLQQIFLFRTSSRFSITCPEINSLCFKQEKSIWDWEIRQAHVRNSLHHRLKTRVCTEPLGLMLREFGAGNGNRGGNGFWNGFGFGWNGFDGWKRRRRSAKLGMVGILAICGVLGMWLVLDADADALFGGLGLIMFAVSGWDEELIRIGFWGSVAVLFWWVWFQRRRSFWHGLGVLEPQRRT
ncbi:hypothetical protein PHJA_000948100, partial [Phtheirospermum japonicum]